LETVGENRRGNGAPNTGTSYLIQSGNLGDIKMIEEGLRVQIEALALEYPGGRVS